MARLNTIDPKNADGRTGELLGAVKKKLGVVPNMTRAMANSPAALEGYLGLSGALGGGELDAKLREKIALLAAQQNGCAYCLAAHSAIGRSVGLSDDDLSASRRGVAEDARDAAALRFARAFLDTKGDVSDAELDAARAAGIDDGAIAEISAHAVLNVYTNYFNRLARTEIDFPKVDL